jgi:hypothetical protein
MPDLMVHFEVKGKMSKDLKKFFDEDDILFDSDDKVTAEVPQEWVGFKNGQIRKVLRHFNESVYIGIAFVTDTTDYYVTDFDGAHIEPFEDVVNRRKVYRYVKKRLSILNEVNKNDDSFEVKRYILNLKYVNPIVKVLDVYSVSSQSRIPSSMFK